jgi:secreted PhoX family phosphatase
MVLIDRREFLQRAGLSVAGLTALSGPLQAIFARGALAVGSTGVAPDNGGYGPLVPVPDETDGVVRLHLPEGFEYRSITPTGTPMDDGVLTPGRHDGMAAFNAGPSRYRLVRNHEINGPVGAFGNPSKAYDPAAGGGTTTLEVNRHATKVDSWVSCNGTQMNCAGGATPWGTWLTCEETVNGPDVGNDFTGGNNSLLTQKHGYVYEVQTSWDAGEHAKPVPIRSAGRFAHEAVDIDPETGFLYLTEDNIDFPSGFYR